MPRRHAREEDEEDEASPGANSSRAWGESLSCTKRTRFVGALESSLLAGRGLGSSSLTCAVEADAWSFLGPLQIECDHQVSPQLRQVMMPSSGSPGTFPKRRFQSKSCPPLLKVSRSFRFWPNRDSDCRKPSLSNQRATGSSEWVQGTEVIFSLTCFNRVTNFPHFLHQTPPASFRGKIA